jgi:hypothetical protein
MFQFVKIWLMSGMFSLFSSGNSYTDIENLRLWFSQGNAQSIGHHMHSSVQLVTPQSEGYYSKAQATMILDKFFKAHPPRTCTVQSQGSSENGAHYCLMNLETAAGNYRVNLFLKKGSGMLLLQEMKIEKVD